MGDFAYEWLKENLERLKMKNTLEILEQMFILKQDLFAMQ